MSQEMWGMSTTSSDHDVVLTLSGNAETFSSHVREALERLGYKVITQQPLQAKRAARGCARMDCSFETLDYPRRLTVALKQVNDSATQATFSYEVTAYMGLSRGDKKTLDCEARAIVAVATQRDSTIACTVCGTTVTDDSRFCRRCGASVVFDVAEIEVLRLMEDTRRGYHRLAIGLIVLLIAMLLPITLIWIDTVKAFRVVTMLSSIIGVLGVFWLIQGLWQLHFALNPARQSKSNTETPRVQTGYQTSELPPRPSQMSVTEGTTAFLISDEQQRARVPVERKRFDTEEVR
jgi:hypothetical protein